MKKATLMILAILALCTSVQAAPDVAITNYFSGYILVPSSFTNAGDTALSVSNAYACIPVATLTQLTEAQASSTTTNSDVRALMFSIMDHLYDTIQAMASTNRPTYLTIEEELRYENSGGSVFAVTRHKQDSRRQVTGSSFPSE